MVLVGIYLGDCVTTAIVWNIGAKPDAKRVGIVNILYNLEKSAAVLIVVTINSVVLRIQFLTCYVPLHYSRH